MIDASVDRDFAAFERQESLKEVRPSAADAAPRVYRGKLASLSVQSGSERGDLEQAARAPLPHFEALHCMTTTPDHDSSPPSPLAHLRAARLGFAAAVILVLYWLWIRQKRKR